MASFCVVSRPETGPRMILILGRRWVPIVIPQSYPDRPCARTQVHIACGSRARNALLGIPRPEGVGPVEPEPGLPVDLEVIDLLDRNLGVGPFVVLVG